MELIPKEKYEMKFNLSGPSQALLVLNNEDGIVDSVFLSNEISAINLPEGIYDFQIASEGYCPVISQFIVKNNIASFGFLELDLPINALDINLEICESSSLNLIEGSLSLLYTENDVYDDNVSSCIEYNGFENSSFIHFNMAYELEWEKDSLLIYLSDENIPDYIYTGQNWFNNDYYIKLNQNIDYSDLVLKFCLTSDDYFGYRGAKINQISGLSSDSGSTLSNSTILPNKIELSQNYPNPFNPSTEFVFSISIPSEISLGIYDIRGVLVHEIIRNKYYNSGKFSISYEPVNLSNVIYFYRVSDGRNTIVKKMIYLK